MLYIIKKYKKIKQRLTLQFAFIVFLLYDILIIIAMQNFEIGY